MPEAIKCMKCGSAEIVPHARVLHGSDYDVHLGVDADPGALLFKESTRISLEARVCGQCGYTEMYATDPAALLAAWRHAQQSDKG